MSTVLEVAEDGHPIQFEYADLMRYHGPGFPGGVAHAFKVLERTLPLLGADAPVERRKVEIRTAFRGPGARDAFEMVTRAVTGDRYAVDESLERPERGRVLERYVFHVRYRQREVVLAIRDDGFVVPEFIDLARSEARTAAEDVRLAQLKSEMAERLLSRPAIEVYDAEVREQ